MGHRFKSLDVAHRCTMRPQVRRLPVPSDAKTAMPHRGPPESMRKSLAMTAASFQHRRHCQSFPGRTNLQRLPPICASLGKDAAPAAARRPVMSFLAFSQRAILGKTSNSAGSKGRLADLVQEITYRSRIRYAVPISGYICPSPPK